MSICEHETLVDEMLFPTQVHAQTVQALAHHI